jgi:hypothetical protein
VRRRGFGKYGKQKYVPQEEEGVERKINMIVPISLVLERDGYEKVCLALFYVFTVRE